MVARSTEMLAWLSYKVNWVAEVGSRSIGLVWFYVHQIEWVPSPIDAPLLNLKFLSVLKIVRVAVATEVGGKEVLYSQGQRGACHPAGPGAVESCF